MKFLYRWHILMKPPGQSLVKTVVGWVPASTLQEKSSDVCSRFRSRTTLICLQYLIHTHTHIQSAIGYRVRTETLQFSCTNNSIHEYDCTQDTAPYLKVKPELVNSEGVSTGMVLQYSR